MNSSNQLPLTTTTIPQQHTLLDLYYYFHKPSSMPTILTSLHDVPVLKLHDAFLFVVGAGLVRPTDISTSRRIDPNRRILLLRA